MSDAPHIYKGDVVDKLADGTVLPYLLDLNAIVPPGSVEIVAEEIVAEEVLTRDAGEEEECEQPTAGRTGPDRPDGR